MKKSKEEKKLEKENKKIAKQEKRKMKKENKKKVDKMQIATRIMAAFLAILMVVGIAATFLYYFLKLV